MEETTINISHQLVNYFLAAYFSFVVSLFFFVYTFLCGDEYYLELSTFAHMKSQIIDFFNVQKYSIVIWDLEHKVLCIDMLDFFLICVVCVCFWVWSYVLSSIACIKHYVLFWYFKRFSFSKHCLGFVVTTIPRLCNCDLLVHYVSHITNVIWSLNLGKYRK